MEYQIGYLMVRRHALARVSLAATALVALTAPSLGAANAASAATATSAAAPTFIDKTVSCSAGNFTGTAELRVTSPSSDGSVTDARVLRYKIQKHNGQQGGNKANINLFIGGNSAKSPDRMIQDGNWHGSELGTAGYGDWGRIQFIFDKSGSDPRCDAVYWNR